MSNALTYTVVYNAIIIYITISFIEWFVHRFIMHGNPKILSKIPLFGKLLSDTARDHKYHHEQILMNMHYIEKHSTNHFTWFATISLGTIFAICFKILTNINDNRIILFICTSMTIGYCFLWNTIHNQMHYTTKTVTLREGVPSVILDRSIIKNKLYKSLYINHGIHHLQKGEKFNYNIVFPMFDHLFFTKKYGKCYNNISYCEINKNKDKRCESKVVGCISTDLKTLRKLQLKHT